MATHSRVLAWRIPGMRKPGGLLSLGSHRVRHDWSDLVAAAAGNESTSNARDLGLIPGLGRSWRRERLPTPVFWPGEFHGLYSPWSHEESDTTEWLSLHFTFLFFFYFLINYWNITALQCCVSFRYTAKFYIYIYFFQIFFIIGYYKMLNIVPCSLQ